MKKSKRDPFRPHAHDPNPHPPTMDADLKLVLPDGRTITLSVGSLKTLPLISVPNCYIVSTGHGTSGPFTFSGVRLLDLVLAYCSQEWSNIEVLSGDGFQSRIYVEDLTSQNPSGPMLLAYLRNGKKLTREQGLVRMIVPGDTKDALRQVKWVASVNICK